MSPDGSNPKATGLDYSLFARSYKPKVRPDGQLERIQAAFRLDVEFFEQFKIFRKILMQSRIDWGQEIVSHLQENDALTTELDDSDAFRIKDFYNKHVRLFRGGRFDENYLDSIEDIALFFVFHDVKTIWIAGAYRELTSRLIDLVMSELEKSMNVPLGHSMKALNLALTVELNQIQRVYTMYEREVSESLVKDLSYGGILTGMPTGRPTKS